MILGQISYNIVSTDARCNLSLDSPSPTWLLVVNASIQVPFTDTNFLYSNLYFVAVS